jgi:hypothetical protein
MEPYRHELVLGISDADSAEGRAADERRDDYLRRLEQP